MKQLFAISFIIALIIPFSSTFIWLKHQKRMVRKEVKHMMMNEVNEDDLVTFSFSKWEVENELEWEHSKEFKYQGNMYDVVTFQELDGKYIYSCWLDKKETKLNKQLAKLFGVRWNSEQGKYHQQSNLNQFVNSLFFANRNYVVFSCIDKNLLSIKFTENTLETSIEGNSPPPKFY